VSPVVERAGGSRVETDSEHLPTIMIRDHLAKLLDRKRESI
jgi:hypothetical protein